MIKKDEIRVQTAEGYRRARYGKAIRINPETETLRIAAKSKTKAVTKKRK